MTSPPPILIATDVHTIADLDDPYNKDFMAAADILFMSDKRLPTSPAEWARAVQTRYGNAIVVIGRGAEGALLAVKGETPLRVPAVATRPVVNTIGAGDALFSAFLHVYAQCDDPYLAMRKAVVFASYKIGAAGAAEGFLGTEGLEEWVGKGKEARGRTLPAMEVGRLGQETGPSRSGDLRSV